MSVFRAETGWMVATRLPYVAKKESVIILEATLCEHTQTRTPETSEVDWILTLLLKYYSRRGHSCPLWSEPLARANGQLLCPLRYGCRLPMALRCCGQWHLAPLRRRGDRMNIKDQAPIKLWHPLWPVGWPWMLKRQCLKNSTTCDNMACITITAGDAHGSNSPLPNCRIIINRTQQESDEANHKTNEQNRIRERERDISSARYYFEGWDAPTLEL